MKEVYLKGKRWCTSLLLLFSALMISQISSGQIVTGGAVVKANFGIDADVYANHFEVVPPGALSPEGIDDWFFNYAGTGQGVIDQTNSAVLLSAVQANHNYSFERGMSQLRNYEDPVSGMIWLDAVYFRDNNSQQGNTDATVFPSGSNKNGDNPSTWSIGPGGTPQKNDLVDVMGHMRRDNNVYDHFFGWELSCRFRIFPKSGEIG